MKKGIIVLIAVIALVLILIISSISAYNGLVTKRAQVEESWANVEAAYQRRSDLIPNLVATVKGYAAHESSTLEGVTEARAKATQPQINIDNLTEENMAKYQAAQNQISGALDRLLAVAESYPDLKASQNFTNLQDELAGTENRINVARRDFNGVVRQYNVSVQSFPNNLFASMFGFTTKAMFAAEEGAEKAPSVQF